MKEYATGPSTVSAQTNSLAPRRTTPIDQVQETFRLARQLTGQINALVSELAGPVPDAVDQCGIATGPGLFSALRSDALETQDCIRGALSEIERLREMI